MSPKATSPYGFVPLPPTIRRARRSQETHSLRVANGFTAAVEVELVTRQAVHVGSGFKVERDGQIVRGTARVGDAWGIPGSSMRGVLRSRYEAITRSCVLFKPKGGRIRSRTLPESVRKAEFTLHPQEQAKLEICRVGELCPACSLFGALALRSRVRVSDFIAERATVALSRVPRMFAPNLHHVGHFKPPREGDTTVKVTSLYGRKFYRDQPSSTVTYEPVEVLPEMTRLAGRLTLSNVTAAEYGGLIVALGALPVPGHCIKVGCAKREGFGSVQVTGVRASVRHGRPVRCLRSTIALSCSSVRTKPGQVDWKRYWTCPAGESSDDLERRTFTTARDRGQQV